MHQRDAERLAGELNRARPAWRYEAARDHAVDAQLEIAGEPPMVSPWFVRVATRPDVADEPRRTRDRAA